MNTEIESWINFCGKEGMALLRNRVKIEGIIQYRQHSNPKLIDEEILTFTLRNLLL